MPGSRSRPSTERNGSTAARSTLHTDTQQSHSDLLETDRLLHLLCHRNKNQHHNQKWWKWLAILRRSIKKLLALEAESAKRGWIRRDEDREQQALKEWLRDIVTPKAWLAFTTLVADNQFSILGVVLIAMLARTCRIIRVPEPEAESQLSLDTDMKARTLFASSLRAMGSQAGEVALRNYVGNGEDLGEMVQRNINCEDRGPTRSTDKSESGKDLPTAKDRVPEWDVGPVHKDGQEGIEAKQQSTQQERQQSRPRKRHKGNAIDELFGDLV